MKILTLIGLILFITSMYTVSMVKKSLSDEELIKYEKSLKPQFLKFYYISIAPLLCLLFLLLYNYIHFIRDHFAILLTLVVLFDAFILFLTNGSMQKVVDSNKFNKIRFYLNGVMIAKSITIIGLLFFLK